MKEYKNIAKVAYMPSPGARWSPADIPYGLIEPSQIVDDGYLFYMVAAASLVEINSDLYTRNLLEYFSGDAEITEWLADYTRLCRPERLGPTRTLELAARCVVETGTASLYTMLSRLSPEPVLAGLFSLIRRDEIRHYRYFYHFFLKYQRREPPGHYAVARTLWQRVKEVENEDAYYAFKHVYLERHPTRHFHDNAYGEFRRHYLALARRYYPYEMAARMFVKPLGLSRRIKRLALPMLAAGAKHIHK